ncbi:MAG: threonine synthase [Selenomonadaceae bacterium]|nr:threonine synthase [Selenomonadaceae bacterium]
MKYVSTRSKIKPINSAEAILQGLASDGGLFVPESIPKVSLEEIDTLKTKTYEQRAIWLLEKFLTDYTEDELGECSELAYNWFDVQRRVPLMFLVQDPKRPETVVASMELWHGPTSAFKDVALQMLPHLMRMALKKVGETKEILILVATSGDTGKAALAGFADVPQTKVMVFYPDGGVSKIQRLQMVTQVGNNVNVTAVRGNFDDAQTGVKKIFGDKNLRNELEKVGVKLSSANSINWGRLVPQIVYYFSGYVEMVKDEKIKLGDKINICVPTGNFGNILAAYYAYKMGLPVNKLICASNINNVLTEFFNTGVYNREREFFKTITPSMDILISSNLERLLYHETGGDYKRVSQYMKDLNSKGKYKIDGKLKAKLDKIFYAEYVTEDETKLFIKRIYDVFKYTMDTHTAVAVTALSKYRSSTGDLTPVLTASTASPYKFTSAVLTALGQSVDGVDDLDQITKLFDLTGMRVPKNLASLATAKVLHEDICDKDEMPDRVIKFASAGKA